MSEELQTRQLTGYVRDLILDRLNKAGTAVQPDHPGMSDARDPTAHTHPVAQLDDATDAGREILGATRVQQKTLLGVNRTPFDAGALGASASLPIDTYLSIEATVPDDTTVTLPAGTLGDRSTVLLTSTASEAVTVTLPTLNWISPFGAIWDGVLAPGQSVRISFVRSSLGWEAVDGRLSTTAIPVTTNASEITVDQAGLQRVAGANAQAAIVSADAAINELYKDLYSDVTDAGSIAGTKTISFASSRYVKAVQTGVTAITFAPPLAPKTVKFRLDPGGYSTTFTNAINWARMAAPNFPTTAGTKLLFIMDWDGSEWFADVEYYGAPA